MESCTALIPSDHRHLFDDIPNFNNIPMDSSVGVACAILIVATNQYVRLLTDEPHGHIWVSASNQCSTLING